MVRFPPIVIDFLRNPREREPVLEVDETIRAGSSCIDPLCFAAKTSRTSSGRRLVAMS